MDFNRLNDMQKPIHKKERKKERMKFITTIKKIRENRKLCVKLAPTVASNCGGIQFKSSNFLQLNFSQLL